MFFFLLFFIIFHFYNTSLVLPILLPMFLAFHNGRSFLTTVLMHAGHVLLRPVHSCVHKPFQNKSNK